MKSYSRTDRLADHIQRQLAVLIQEELQDEQSGLITVSKVKVSPDLSFATVYVTVYRPGDASSEDLAGVTYKDVIAMLNEQAAWLRSLLAKSAQMRVTPKLRFFYDETVTRGRYLSSLIDKAVTADKQSKSEEE